MRIMLKLVLDCDADAAWRALHSPRAVADLYGPFVELAPMAAEGLPLRLEPGADVPVRMSVAGRIGLGQQLIHVSERHVDDANGPVRIFRDSGIPLTGPLAALDVWDHQMAVSPRRAIRLARSGVTGSSSAVRRRPRCGPCSGRRGSGAARD
jgi:hypothetical protein